MDKLLASAEAVLKLWRQLPSLEQLYVVELALLELRHSFPVAPTFAIDFWQGADLHLLARCQPVKSLETPSCGEAPPEAAADFAHWRRHIQEPVKDAAHA